MKTKQMALTLMFFVCFALFFTGCKSMTYSNSWTRTRTVKINVPKDKPPVTQEVPPKPDPDPDPPKPDPKPVDPLLSRDEITIKVTVDPRSTPLTLDLVRNIQNAGLSFRDLDYSLSKSFAMTIIGHKDVPKKLEISDRILTAPQEQNITSARMVFTPEHKGALNKDTDVSPETFVIDFTSEEKQIPLTFKRNAQGRYDLVSAMIDNERSTVFAIEDDPPQLCILTELNEHLETLAIFNSNQAVSQRWQSYEAPAYQKIPAGGLFRQSEQSRRIDNSSSSRQFVPSRRIDDAQSYVTIEGITRYVRNQNPNVDLKKLSELFDTYKIEAKIEGINLDIAIAQMLHATNYLRNRTTTHNYAGLSTNGVPWDGSFPDMRTGVKAHIQHLKGYVSTNRPVPCVDPRYDTLVKSGYGGQVKTFDQLFKAWSQNPAYGNEINRILNGLRSSR